MLSEKTRHSYAYSPLFHMAHPTQVSTIEAMEVIIAPQVVFPDTRRVNIMAAAALDHTR